MTRKEQIYNEADKYAKHAQVSLKDFISTAFANGAAWADNKWNEFPEIKPTEKTDYIVSDGKGVYVREWDGKNFTFLDKEEYEYDKSINYLPDHSVKYWREFPKAPNTNQEGNSVVDSYFPGNF